MPVMMEYMQAMKLLGPSLLHGGSVIYGFAHLPTRFAFELAESTSLPSDHSGEWIQLNLLGALPT